MGAMASQITSLPIIYSTVYSGADQRKFTESGPVNSPHKWPINAENASIWWRHHEKTP